MSYLVAALDDALAQAGEDIILRRIVGTAPNQINIDVMCRARVDAATVQEILAGIPATDLHVTMSPTQINNAQWPGGQGPLLPPFQFAPPPPRKKGPAQGLFPGASPPNPCPPP